MFKGSPLGRSEHDSFLELKDGQCEWMAEHGWNMDG